MKAHHITNVGIIGCGNISEAYFSASKTFKMLKIISCADLRMDAAQAKAEQYGCTAQSVEELLSNPEVELVLNLTLPKVHAEVNIQALKAGKHVYAEKPFATNLEDGRKALELATAKGLHMGCAPDTFLGAGLQSCRKLIDDGAIGRVTSGTAFMLCPGHESWHPNPGFYYLKGGGPMFDMGPYYITALVHLLGPIRGVCATASQAHKERIASCEEKKGTVLPVEVPTHYAGVLDFHSGAQITMTLSFDVIAPPQNTIELFGTEGSLRVPDPNTFDGPIQLFTKESWAWEEMPLTHIYDGNMRSIGVADMACAIQQSRGHRANGALAFHTLEVMAAFETSSESGRYVAVESKPNQPAPLPTNLTLGQLD